MATPLQLRSPQTLLVAGFAGVILLGAVLLRLPGFRANANVTFLDALFTSTSAVCVTGLTVVDTEKDYTVLGQTTIMLLIQVGGLGIMTYAALAAGALGRRVSLRFREVLHDTIFQRDAGREFRASFRRILVVTATIEGTGAAVLFVFLLARGKPALHALRSAVFHAVSAFCNAGFSVYSDNLVGLRDSWGIVLTIAALIVLGGLGFTVVDEVGIDLRRRLRRGGERVPPRSLHAKVVLRTTALLLAIGFVGLLVFGLTPGETTWEEKLSGAIFQSVTPRTAGYNTVDIARLPQASLFLLVVLMFIGGSPSSCAGGIKTTSVAVWAAAIAARLRGREDVTLGGRRLPETFVEKTLLLVGLAVAWNVLGFFVLLLTEGPRAGVTLTHVVFEQISAFGTVGLSMSFSPTLTAAGKLWIILTMYVGRLGPLTLATWLMAPARARVRLPEGKVMIG